jgi:hypothetical protein
MAAKGSANKRGVSGRHEHRHLEHITAAVAADRLGSADRGGANEWNRDNCICTICGTRPAAPPLKPGDTRSFALLCPHCGLWVCCHCGSHALERVYQAPVFVSPRYAASVRASVWGRPN